jgi:hypothetical protein
LVCNGWTGLYFVLGLILHEFDCFHPVVYTVNFLLPCTLLTHQLQLVVNLTTC